jgi:hypothetical protein
VPSADHLTAAVKRATLHDTNYARYLAPTVSEFMMVADGTYKMKPAGTVEAKRIFGEMLNSGVEGFAYWKADSRPSKRTTRLNSDEQTQIEDWIAKPIETGSLDVRVLLEGSPSCRAAHGIRLSCEEV